MYAARTHPVLGLNTDIDPMGLADGYVPELLNYRITAGILQCRGGMSSKINTVTTLATSAYRGSHEGWFQNAYNLFLAVYDSSVSKTLVYKSTDGITWTEITTAATRLTGNAPVSFAIISDPFQPSTASSYQKLLVSDGTGAVRILSPNVATAATMDEIMPPTCGDYPVEVRVIESKIVDWQGSPTYTPSDTAKIDFAASGSAPNKFGLMTIKTAVTVGTTAQVSAGTTGTTCAPADRQLLIVVNTAYPLLWDKLKVEFSSVVCWDPTSPTTTMRPVPISLDGTNTTLWVFNFPYNVTSSTNFGGPLKFTWVAATSEAPSANVDVKFYMAGITYGSLTKADGAVGVAYGSSTSLVQSPGVIYSHYTSDRLSDHGGPILNGLSLRRSPLLQAVFYAKVKQVPAAAITAGVNTARFYYKAAGEKKYKYSRPFTLTGSAGDILRSVASPYWAVSAPDVVLDTYGEVYFPDARHIPPPSAKCMAYVNDRLMIGGAAASNRNFYVSANKNPLHFRTFTNRNGGRVDPDDPITRTVGTGVYQKIVPMASSLIGADTFFIFTSEGVFAGAGNTSDQLEQVARVSKFGTVSPLSIAELNGAIFYLDTEMQVRKFQGGQPVSISKSWVANNLYGIPAASRAYVAGAVDGDLYHLAYAPAGATTNTRVLIWDDNQRFWMMDEPPTACQGLISWFDGTNVKKRLFAFGPRVGAATTLDVFEYGLATQTQDFGTTNITCAITFPYVHSEEGKAIIFQRVGITCDDVSGSTGSVVRTYMPDGSTATGSISIDGSLNHIVRYDGSVTIAGGAGNGVACQLRVSLPLTAGKKVYKIIAEVEPRGHAYDRSA